MTLQQLKYADAVATYGSVSEAARRVFVTQPTLTEAIRTQFRKMTSLEQVDLDGDMEISGAITGYEVRASAVTANEVAAQNRLTINIKLEFTNRKYPEDDFEKTFSGYADYDSMQSLDAVEASLCEEIIEKLVDDIFNATVANW